VIDILNIATANRHEHLCHGTRIIGRQEKVDVICHKHVGVQPAAFPVQRFVQQIYVNKPVLLFEEAGPSIVPPSHNVQREAVYVDSAAAGHTKSLTEIDPDPYWSQWEEALPLHHYRTFVH